MPRISQAHPSYAKLKYSIAWARKIVGQMTESHARGWEIFAKYSGKCEDDLVVLLAQNDADWPWMRMLVQRLDTIPEQTETPIQMYSEILDYMPRQGHEETYLGLTDALVNVALDLH